MKGYTTITVHEARSALAVNAERVEQAKALRSDGIKRYYKKFYTEGAGWYTRWRYKNYNDRAFCHAHMGAFDRWADLLHVVLTREETDLVDWLDWGAGSMYASKLESLVGASSSGTIIIDDQLCKFVSKYRK